MTLNISLGEEKENKWKKSIKNGTKALYIQFYKEIVEVSDTLQDTRNIEGDILSHNNNIYFCNYRILPLVNAVVSALVLFYKFTYNSSSFRLSSFFGPFTFFPRFFLSSYTKFYVIL